MTNASAVLGRYALPLLVTVLTASWIKAAAADEWRAFWVEGWNAGFHTQSQVDTLLGVPGNASSKGDIRNGNCNAVIVEVRRRGDVAYPSGVTPPEPYMSGLSPSNFNALQAMINAAHDTTGGKQRVEVHCWNVAFALATDSSPTPPTGSIYYLHNDPANADQYWMTRDNYGTETNDKAMDPGHPKCLQYLVNVCMDLVRNFDIDGIHYDYIRFTANNQGYNPTSIARYNERYGLTGQPAPDDEQFKQWRRDQVTALVRQVYARIQHEKPSVKQSGSFVTWNPSPTSSTRAGFMATRPYYDVYSDWDSWLQEGIVDMGVPMTYYNWASLPSDYTRWMNFEKDRHGNRHMIIGPGLYLNSLSNAIYELQLTRNASPAGNYADGYSGYDWQEPYASGTWAGFQPSLVTDVNPTTANIPAMPWKTSPTTAHIMGTVTYAGSGAWADHATVTVTGPTTRSMYVDGTGFYAFIDLPLGSYTVRASKCGCVDVGATVNIAVGQVTGNMYVQDLQFGVAAPYISGVQVSVDSMTEATVTWSTNLPASSQVEYGTTTSYGTLSPLDGTSVTAHSVSLSGLTPNTTYHFRARSGNGGGTALGCDGTFTTPGPLEISNVQATGVTANTATITWTTNNAADSQVQYGLTSEYGTPTPLDPAPVTAHAVALTALTPNTTYHYQALSANGYDSAESGDYTFTTLDITADIVIDNLDPGWSDTSPSGAWSHGSLANVPHIGSDYLYAAGTGSTSESSITVRCRWTPNIPLWGTYDVYVFYQIGTNRNSAAPFKVFYSGGSLTSIQNQYGTGGTGNWVLLGSNLPFAAGTAGYVQCANNSADTRLVSADAARFVRTAGDTTPPTQPEVADDGASTDSYTSLHATWSACVDPESGIKSYAYRIREQGGTIARDWTDVSTATSVTATGLALSIGRTYIIDVRATNNSDVVGPVGSSDGILVFTFDVDSDGHIAEADFGAFQQCLSGATLPFPTGLGVDCGRFDVDRDGDVDQRDFGAFQGCLTGTEPLDLACVN